MLTAILVEPVEQAFNRSSPSDTSESLQHTAACSSSIADARRAVRELAFAHLTIGDIA